MELSPKQQIAELIKNNQRILIVGHKSHGGDLLGSMLAFEKVLARQGKEVSLVLTEAVDQSLIFLPGVEKIVPDVPARDLIIQIDKAKTDIEKIAYNEENGVISIVISPKGKLLEPKDLKITPGNYNFDLIFVLDTPDVEKIDTVYDKYTELFFEVPIVNIDHHSGNEYFGTVNLVDLTATSTAEILVSIIEAMGPNNFDADVATCLLTGLIADTSSFKNTNTTPKSLTISAQMLAAGARQQEIIQNLYKTRPLQTLKLWGKVLSNIVYDREHRLVVSGVTMADLSDASANAEDIRGVLDELLASAPGTDIVLVLAEEKGKLVGYLKGLNGQDVLAIAENFGGHGRALEAVFSIPNATLATHKEKVLLKLAEAQDSQLVKSAVMVTENTTKLTSAQTVFVETTPDIQTPKVIPTDVVVEVTLKAETVEDLGDLLSIEKALEGVESVEEEPRFEDIFTQLPPKVEEVVSLRDGKDAIEEALISIDTEIESGGPIIEVTPNIDIEGVKDKKESLRKLGEVMRGYTPGKALDDPTTHEALRRTGKGNQPIDSKMWK